MTFDELKTAQMNGTGMIEIDTGTNPGVANDARFARQASWEHTQRVARGEREAHLYTKSYDAQREADGLPRAAEISIGVSLEQARELIAVGAKWFGPDAFRP